MGVYIRDMEMPENCGDCMYRHLSMTGRIFCTVAHGVIPFETGKSGRLDNCPLVDVPEPPIKNSD